MLLLVHCEADAHLEHLFNSELSPWSAELRLKWLKSILTRCLLLGMILLEGALLMMGVAVESLTNEGCYREYPAGKQAYM